MGQLPVRIFGLVVAAFFVVHYGIFSRQQLVLGQIGHQGRAQVVNVFYHAGAAYVVVHDHLQEVGVPAQFLPVLFGPVDEG